jgi:hypothetical protein
MDLPVPRLEVMIINSTLVTMKSMKVVYQRLKVRQVLPENFVLSFLCEALPFERTTLESVIGTTHKLLPDNYVVAYYDMNLLGIIILAVVGFAQVVWLLSGLNRERREEKTP